MDILEEKGLKQKDLACHELTEQIKATDNEIDQRVFDLYGLTQKNEKL